MNRFESRDVMMPVSASESGELAWADADMHGTCKQPSNCGACTNTTQKKPKIAEEELDDLRAQLEATLA
jgi:hypothetical protein